MQTEISTPCLKIEITSHLQAEIGKPFRKHTICKLMEEHPISKMELVHTVCKFKFEHNNRQSKLSQSTAFQN
jgi:hypothetical protein